MNNEHKSDAASSPNSSSFMQLVSDIANEIEKVPGSPEETPEVCEKPQSELSNKLNSTCSTDGSSEAASEAASEVSSKIESCATPSSTCYFRTRSSNFKSYAIKVTDVAIEFARENSVKDSSIAYGLSKVQCLESFSSQDESNSPAFSLLIIHSKQNVRQVFFDSREAQSHWFKTILSAQGFYDNRMAAYETVLELGVGAFGQVLLAKHVNSGFEVALKVISKANIEKSFGQHQSHYQELQVLKELA